MITTTEKRMTDIADLLIRIYWYQALPLRYKLIWKAMRVRELIESSESRYESTVKNGINSPEKARVLRLAEALRKECISEKDFRRGDMMDDLRDYRLTCELHNLPLCCPHYVKSKEAPTP